MKRLQVENNRLHEQLELMRLGREEHEQDLLESQRQLEASRQRYADLYDSAPVGFLSLSANGLIVGLNLEAAAMLGSERRFLGGRPLVPFFARADRRAFLHHLGRCRRGESPVRTMLTLAPKGGDLLVPVELVSTVARSDDGGRVWRSALTDLTRHTEAENAVRREEERARLALQAGQMATWDRILPDGAAVWNDEHYRMLGLEPGSAPAGFQTWADRVHPDDFPDFARGFQRSLELGGDFHCEFRVLWPDRSVHWLEARCRTERDERNRPVRSYGVMMDVTERRKLDDALRKYAQFPRENPDPVLRVSGEGLLLYANIPAREWLDTLGWQHDAPLPAALLAAVADVYARDRAAQAEVTSPSGTTYWLSLVRPRGEDYVNIYARDITARKRAEEALFRQEEQYRLLFENNPNPMYVFDEETLKILAVNETMEQKYGWSRAELLKMTILDLRPPGEIPKLLPALERQRGSREIQAGTWLHWRKDRSPMDVEIVISCIAYQGRAARLVLVNDITERKRAEEALRASEDQLKRAQEIAHLGSWEMDLLRNRLTWSDEVFRIFGLKPQEFRATYAAFLRRVHPDDRMAVNEAYLGSIRQDRNSYEMEHRLVRKDTGEVRIVHEKCEHIRNADGRIVRSLGMVHDITGRKRAEEALRASEERLAGIVGSAMDAIITVDERQRILLFNTTAERIFGWKAADLLGQPLARLIPARHHVAHAAHFSDFGTKKKRAQLMAPSRELSAVRAGGEEFPIEAAISQVAVGGAKVFTVILRDITARKQAEAALRASEMKFRTLFESASDGIFIADRTGRYVDVNQRGLDMLGRTREWVLRRTIAHIVAPHERPRVPAAVKEVLEGRGRLSEWSFVRRDGSILFGEVNATRLGDGRVIGIVRDVTERKEAEAAMRESEERLRFHTEHSPMAVVEWDSKLAITRWAGEAEKFFGWKAAEAIGRKMDELKLVHRDDVPYVRQTMKKLCDGVAHHVVLHNRNTTKAGGVRHCVWYNSVLHDAGGRMRSVMSRVLDVTDQKLAEEEVRRVNAELEQRVRQRTAELHRTNRLLRAEMAKREKLQTQLLTTTEREQKRIGEDLHDGLCQVITGARFRNALLGQRLRTVRPEEACEADAIEVLLKDAVEQARDLSYGLNPLSPSSDGLMRALNQLAARTKTGNGQRCVCHIPEPVEIPDHAVALQLYRIAQEAVQNALKHSQARTIAIELARRDGGVTLCVMDDGVGMKNPRTAARGMGLTNMNRRARLVGGTMEIQTAERRGIAVICRLPLARRNGKAEDRPAAAGGRKRRKQEA